jgi:hypothetical protein
VSITWKSDGALVTNGNGVTAKSGDFSASSQKATIELESVATDRTFLCEVKSKALQSSATATKSVDVFVYSKYFHFYILK